MKTTKDYVLLHLDYIFYGILGLLARLGLEQLGQYQGPLNGVLWSNFAGSLWMGFIGKHSLILPETNVVHVPISPNDDNSEGDESGLTISPGNDDILLSTMPDVNQNYSDNARASEANNFQGETPKSDNDDGEGPAYMSQTEPGRKYRLASRQPSYSGPYPSNRSNQSSESGYSQPIAIPQTKTTYTTVSTTPSKADTPIFNSFTTGFAGSFTTFSSFILETFNFSANVQPAVKHTQPLPPVGSHEKIESISRLPFPNPSWGVPMGLAYAITTMAVSFGGYMAGRHLAVLIERGFSTAAFDEKAEEKQYDEEGNHILTSTERYAHRNWLVRKFRTGIFKGTSYKNLRYLEYVSAVLGVLTYLLMIALIIVSNTSVTEKHKVNITKKWRYWVFAMLFTPIAVYLRYWMIRLLNPLVWKGKFPFGTFLCNMLATAILAVLTLLERGGNVAGNGNRIRAGGVECDLIKALCDGFCGSLSTISTFVNEMYGLNKAHSYIYGTASLLVGYGLFALITGTYIWTNGINDVCY